MDRPSPPAAACPICGQPTQQRYRPFCSRRCADIDLGRWLKGKYAVPAEEVDDVDVGPEADDLGSDPDGGSRGA